MQSSTITNPITLLIDSWRLLVTTVLIMGLPHLATATEPAIESATTGKPLWEIGLGAGAAYYPNYRGSSDYNIVGAPLPLIIYRGDVLKVSRDGARAELFDHPRFDISISGSGTLPVDSDHDERRQGLPDLDLTFEIGPRLSWLFSDPAQKDQYSLRLLLPVYAAAATDLSDFETIGFTLKPQLRWRQNWSFSNRDHDWSYTLSAGPTWATGEYNDYFYSVAPRFSNATRPAYNASGGYSGFASRAGISHRRGRLLLGAVVSFDYLKGATFEHSPLVATNESFVAGLYVAWTFWKSKARAPELNSE